MKKILFITTITLLLGLTKVNAQLPPVQPIPSFNYQMTTQHAYFYELSKGTTSGKEKRDMDVVVNTRTTSGIPGTATVFVFKVETSKILGPFYVEMGQHLIVPIDNGKWGVRVDCLFPVDVSVWIDD